MPGPYRILGLTPRAIGLLVFAFIAYVIALFAVPGVAGFVGGLYSLIGGNPETGEWSGAVLVQRAVALFRAPADLLVLRPLEDLAIRAGITLPQWLGLPLGIAGLFLAWIFWSTLFVRSAYYLGVWDPFGNVKHQGRRFILAGWVRLQNAAEMNARFGKGPTGGFAGLIEVLSNRFLPGDLFLGRPGRFWFLRPIGIQTERHVVTIAQTGSGKSTAALIPNLCIHEGPLVCVDPKGELAAITAPDPPSRRQWRQRPWEKKVIVLQPVLKFVPGAGPPPPL